MALSQQQLTRLREQAKRLANDGNRRIGSIRLDAFAEQVLDLIAEHEATQQHATGTLQQLAQERAQQLVYEWKQVADWHDKTCGPNPERTQQLLINVIAYWLQEFVV